MLLVGFYRTILTLSMRAFGPRVSAYAFWTTTDTYRPTYIYILEKWFPLWGERAHVFLLYSALNPLIQPSPHFIFTFLCFHRSSQALILTPYLSRLCFSWSSVSEDLIFSSCIFFSPSCSTFFLLEIVLSNRAWSLKRLKRGDENELDI